MGGRSRPSFAGSRCRRAPLCGAPSTDRGRFPSPGTWLGGVFKWLGRALRLPVSDLRQSRAESVSGYCSPPSRSRRTLIGPPNACASPAARSGCCLSAPSGACAVGPSSRCECPLGGSECRLFDLNPFPHDSFDPFIDPTLTMESGQKRGPSGQLRRNGQGGRLRSPDYYGFLPC